ncbi:hypothetical protein Glove_51g70 [Diversispora epigaea]|uniref:U6 small nuclear RNA (adenine-(43)-N(6))-methyltransferase n=1 Tax=Diversispora epigaea TaxID=1348612 RepID=A0A397JDN4_9GLOM|nr:hypothetical protein Glove_51g70 [Diversispora epigaea]
MSTSSTTSTTSSTSASESSSNKVILGKRSHTETIEKGESNNGQMHSRNRYRNNPPDFAVLAFKYSSFYPYVKYTKEGKPYIDFKNPEAVRELTYCLLRNDFNLILEIPLDSLCPPIPNRLNYIHWIEDLITISETRQDRTIYGIDIGTGASCIYPLLACTLNKNWVMLATEIDEKSVEYAENNVLRNNLESKISVVLNKTDKKILLSEEVMINNNIRFAFCMCNPPFYESQEQYEKGVEIKQTPSLSVCNGTSREKFTPGGEFQFIKDILDESLVLRNKIRWYTSMIGRLETVNKIVRELKRTGIDNYVVTEFCQGQTRRWGIGWSFGSQRPSTSIINQTSKKLRKISQPKTEFRFGIPADSHDVIGCILVHLNELDIDGNFNDENGTFFGSAKTNTWSRAARRQRMKSSECQKESKELSSSSSTSATSVTTTASTTTATDESTVFETLFEFTLRLEPWKSNATNTKVTFSWTNGKDRNVFESFYSHVKKWMEQKFAANDNE